MRSGDRPTQMLEWCLDPSRVAENDSSVQRWNRQLQFDVLQPNPLSSAELAPTAADLAAAPRQTQISLRAAATHAHRARSCRTRRRRPETLEPRFRASALVPIATRRVDP